ncbi:MAG: MaoC family dehydratase N-terminal domain-containing protein [Acidimicrobiia bacterium]
MSDNPQDVPSLTQGMTFEQMEAGLKFRTSKRTITEADLMSFVNLFGFNEPLFYDASNAAESNYTGRLCPGAFVYCMAEGLVLQTHALHGTGMAFLHMDLDIKKPTYVGDTIYAVVEITGCRPTSAGDRGIVDSTISIYNQRDELTVVFTPRRMIRGRSYQPASK